MFKNSLTLAALSAGFIVASAHAQRIPEAADPGRAGTPVVADSPIRSYKNAQAMAQPTNSWTEANVAVTSQDGHAMHGMQHSASPGQAAPNPHAGHAGHASHSNATAQDDHSEYAGHAPQSSTGGPGAHANHLPKNTSPAVKPAAHADHSMHQMGGHGSHAGQAKVPDSMPHAGHGAHAGQGVAPKADPHAGHVMPKASTPAGKSSGHESHSMHEMNTTKAAPPAPGRKAVRKPEPAKTVKPAVTAPHQVPAPKPASQTPAEMDHGGHQ